MSRRGSRRNAHVGRVANMEGRSRPFSASMAMRRHGSEWINGEVDVFGERFEYQAKVYDEGSMFGIGGGPVSKLIIKPANMPSWQYAICSYDRGWDVMPQGDDIDVFCAVMERLDSNFWNYAADSFEYA